MAKVLGGLVCAAVLMALLLGLMTDVNDPSTLRTVEYLANSETALADRAGMREHAEAMARIEAERDVELAYWSTMRTGYVVGGLGVVALVIVGVIAASKRRAPVDARLEAQRRLHLEAGVVDRRWRVVEDEPVIGRLYIEQKGRGS